MSDEVKSRLTRPGLCSSILAMAVTLCWVIPAAAQYPAASVGASRGGRTLGKCSERSCER
jgi:hypothetical protein